MLLQVDTYDDMTSLVLSQELKEKLDRVIKEYLKKETLSKYGLANRRKLLLYGASGTGKTMTASDPCEKNSICHSFVVRTGKSCDQVHGRNRSETR